MKYITASLSPASIKESKETAPYTQYAHLGLNSITTTVSNIPAKQGKAYVPPQIIPVKSINTRAKPEIIPPNAILNVFFIIHHLTTAITQTVHTH